MVTAIRQAETDNLKAMQEMKVIKEPKKRRKPFLQVLYAELQSWNEGRIDKESSSFLSRFCVCFHFFNLRGRAREIWSGIFCVGHSWVWSILSNGKLT